MPKAKAYYSLEDYFEPYRNNIIGIQQYFQSPYGEQKIVYADWTASGRLYQPIEDILSQQIAPYVANTHTETSITGATMTAAYHQAAQIIKKHVNAHASDVFIAADSGMTGVVNKLQRILGLRLHERFRDRVEIAEEERPVIFITHMEHHSNQTSWIETIGRVVVVSAGEDGLIDLDNWEKALEMYKAYPNKIAAVTSCSNVTGLKTPYHKIAALMHKHGGICFVDFACSAPYININMHPANPEERLDAIYFSPHKFLGGPGTPGILVFDSALYKNKIPDVSGGGTVKWTNPWGEHSYVDSIEAREDGGTPAFMQTIKAALCIKLKEEMGVDNILMREKEILDILFKGLKAIPNVHILAGQHEQRLGVLSFYIEDMHYNLVVRMLSDRFGVQVRGGCSCAGTYGHYLLNVDQERSKSITEQINQGCLTDKPGWVRMSIHPTTTNNEAEYLIHAVEQVATHGHEWKADYVYKADCNEYHHYTYAQEDYHRAKAWFEQELV